MIVVLKCYTYIHKVSRMKKIILMLLICCPIICIAQGSIQGNVFWKYNDYVGNKPDAGSEVYLFSKDTSASPAETQCDVMGNFKFGNVNPGQYAVIIISRNTNDNGDYNFIFFDTYNKESKYFFGFDIKQYSQYSLLDTLNKLIDTEVIQDSAIHKKKITLWNYNKRYNENNLADLEVIKARDSLSRQKQLILQNAFKNCRQNSKIAFSTSVIFINEKIYFQPITINGNENKTIVADFGISYSL